MNQYTLKANILIFFRKNEITGHLLVSNFKELLIVSFYINQSWLLFWRNCRGFSGKKGSELDFVHRKCMSKEPLRTTDCLISVSCFYLHFRKQIISLIFSSMLIVKIQIFFKELRYEKSSLIYYQQKYSKFTRNTYKKANNYCSYMSTAELQVYCFFLLFSSVFFKS